MNPLDHEILTPVGALDPVEAVVIYQQELAKAVAVEVLPPEPDHKVRKHHALGMSKLNYLDPMIGCPGFLSQDGTSEAAEDGTRLHEIMDRAIDLYKQWRAVGHSSEAATLIDALKECLDGEAIDDDEFELLAYCARSVQKYLNMPGAEIHNEITVSIKRTTGEELNYGSLDLLVVWNGGKTGVLADWKFGWVPVPPAPENRQGEGYTIGSFQMFPKLATVGAMFVQPRLNQITRHIYKREGLHGYFRHVENIIDTAVYVRANRETTTKLLRVGDHCTYCSLKGTCPAMLERMMTVAKAIHPVALPESFNVDRIQTPEQAARARFALEVIEGALEDIKARTKEVCQANGGVIEADVNGETVRYEIQGRRSDRVLGDTPLVFDALKEIVTAEQLLNIADLPIGKLEALVGDEIYSMNNGPLDAQLKSELAAIDAQKKSGVISAKIAAERTKATKAAIKEQKITKEGARERLSSLLESQGLLSRPDLEIQTMRRKKVTKQLN